jgi:hypothetical protein
MPTRKAMTYAYAMSCAAKRFRGCSAMEIAASLDLIYGAAKKSRATLRRAKSGARRTYRRYRR